MRLLLALLIGLLVAAPARSEASSDDWTIDRAASAIEMEVRAFGGPARGRFERYEGSIGFDPDAPERTSARFRVEAGSLKMQPAAATSRALGRGFLDVERYPDIRFQLDSLKPLGGDRFEAAANVTIKGRTQRLVFPLDLRETGGRAQMTGGFEIDRDRYGIGVGTLWDRAIDRRIRITVRLSARRTG